MGRALTAPHPSIEREEVRHEATRTAALTALFVVIILAVITTVPFILDPTTPAWRAPIFLGGGLAVLLYLPAYALARSRHPRAGALLLVWGAIPAVWLLVQSGQGTAWERGALNYLLFPCMLASLLLPIRHGLAVWVVSFAFAAWHGPPQSDPDFGEFTNTLILLGAFPPLLGLGAYLRQQQVRTIDEQTDQLHAILDAAPQAMIAVDLKGRLLVANARAVDLFGYTHAELLGRTVDDLVPEARRARHTSERTAYQEHPTTRRFGEKLGLEALRKDGGIVPVEISLSPVRGGKQVVASIVDISDRIAAQTELLTFRSLMDRAADALVIFDVETLRFHYANQTALELLGYSQDEFLALEAQAIQGGEPSLARVKDRLRDLLAHPALTFESRFRSKLGREFPVEVSAHLVSVGTRRHAVVGFRDITQRLQHQETLVRAKEAAEAGSRAKDLFLATMSHELRTPLNGILGAAQLLGLSKLDLEQADLVRTVTSAGDSLLDLLSSMLDYTAFLAGTATVGRQPFRVAPLIEAAVRPQRAAADVKGLRLAIVTENTGGDPSLLGDPTRIHQMLSVLVSNAVKFTTNGSVRVAWSARRDGSLWLVRITVEDTGPGVPQDLLPHLFEPFWQGDSNLNRQHGGTGLGLALAQLVAKAMGGLIEVHSSSAGSVFSFEAPFQEAPPG